MKQGKNNYIANISKKCTESLLKDIDVLNNSDALSDKDFARLIAKETTKTGKYKTIAQFLANTLRAEGLVDGMVINNEVQSGNGGVDNK